MKTSRRVKAANKASLEDISAVADLLGTATFGGAEFTFRVARGSKLPASDQDAIWNLYEANMRGMTETSSFGWDPAQKKEELFHDNSRYILVLRDDAAIQAEKTGPSIAAFSHFRFEFEDDEDLVYCYELQVAESLRRRGLASFLVEKLATIGGHWRMEKIMLTVLKKNKSARRLYSKVGFVVDPCSPDEDPGVDYEILSKTL